MNWKEWFAKANKIAWQGVDVKPELHAAFEASNATCCTEAMYQAFKARFLEETTTQSNDGAGS
jgi:hypothetical protein